MNIIKKIRHFFTDTIWDAELLAMSAWRRWIYRLCRIIVLSARGFSSDHCTLTASALTYITLVSLVPILAVTLAFCKGVGLQDRVINAIGLEKHVSTVVSAGKTREVIEYAVIPRPKAKSAAVQDTAADAVPESVANDHAAHPTTEPPEPSATLPAMPPEPKKGLLRTVLELARGDDQECLRKSAWAASLPEPMQDALIRLFTYVDHTNFAALGLVGLLTMIITVVLSIRKLESNFNAIWRIRRNRLLARQFSEYLIALLMTPLVLLVVITVASFVLQGGIARAVNATGTASLLLSEVSGAALLFADLSLGFLFLYKFMPNTRVDLKAASTGAVIAAILWCAVCYAYIKWQVGLANFNAIYGSFAALPFFLAWLYATWNVVLFGVEVTYSIQNNLLLRKSKVQPVMAPSACYVLGVLVMSEICKSFDKGEGKWNAAEFARNRTISILELETVLTRLVNAKLVVRLNNSTDEESRYDYMPAMPTNRLTLADVANAFVGLHVEGMERICSYLPEHVVTLLRGNHDESQRELAQHTLDSLE